MKDRIDALIAERAPWLTGDSATARLSRSGLNNLLSAREALSIAETLRPMPSDRIMRVMGRLLARDVAVSGLDNIPAHGPALVVANHPTGIADGIVLHKTLARVRGDTYFFANHDILRLLPQMADMIAPVEWRIDRRSHAKTRETMAFTRRAVQDGRLGVIFPSGRLAKRRGLALHERPWMASAAMIARKFDLPVIPVNIQARNSALFYLFDKLHPTLRDITLFHETLNKRHQPFRITIAPPVPASALSARSDEAIETLRLATLFPDGCDDPAVSLIATTRKPRWPRALAQGRAAVMGAVSPASGVGRVAVSGGAIDGGSGRSAKPRDAGRAIGRKERDRPVQ